MLQHHSWYFVSRIMLRLVFSVALGLLSSISYGQLKKFYSLKGCSGYDTVNFSLEASAGNCLLKSDHSESGTLNIYGNPDLEKVNPSFKANVSNNTCKVNLALQEFKSTSLGDGIMFAMLGGAETLENNYWKILFDTEMIYKLDLNYGFGNADVDLSGTTVKDLKIRSGSADVRVDYSTREANPIAMDTFMVKVDMGSLVAKNIDCANAEHVIANIGFGKALLDFSQPAKKKCTVKASVGAGNLDIYIPEKDVPVIIYVKDSPLCGMKLAHGFEQVEKNVFVNMGYSASAPNLLTFDLDVAMGNVAFHYAD
jgi:nitrogen fixation protein